MTKMVVIQWENGWGGSGGLKQIFFDFSRIPNTRTNEKSVRIRPIRLIRSPIVSALSKVEITA
jgi:hypothetical protein